MSRYNDILELIHKSKTDGLCAIVVYKPNTNADAGFPEDPDMIVCTHDDPNVIAALLGNYNPTKIDGKIGRE